MDVKIVDQFPEPDRALQSTHGESGGKAYRKLDRLYVSSPFDGSSESDV